MKQEDINNLLKTPVWCKRQSNSYFTEKATKAMKKAVKWIEDDRCDGYTAEEWYWEMKRLLMDS